MNFWLPLIGNQVEAEAKYQKQAIRQNPEMLQNHSYFHSFGSSTQTAYFVAVVLD